MKIQLNMLVAALVLGAVATGIAGDVVPMLKVGDEVYTNITVTTVTATDIYFSHSKGMGNAKLKNLAPDLQKKFNFDPAKSSVVEKQQAEATARFHQQAIAAKPVRSPDNPDEPSPVTEENGDPVVTKLYAKSFRGQRPPQIIVDQWITSSPPGVDGKFVLVDFWATWCGPCKHSIPHLNDLQARFKDKLVVIGLTDEPVDTVRQMSSLRMNYCVGTDPQARTRNAVEVTGIPHAMLMDPKGIVRFEGQPTYLNAQSLERLIAKYSN